MSLSSGLSVFFLLFRDWVSISWLMTIQSILTCTKCGFGLQSSVQGHITNVSKS